MTCDEWREGHEIKGNTTVVFGGDGRGLLRPNPGNQCKGVDRTSLLKGKILNILEYSDVNKAKIGLKMENIFNFAAQRPKIKSIICR